MWTAPISLWFMKTTALAHCDAVGWEPSTASSADMRNYSLAGPTEEALVISAATHSIDAIRCRYAAICWNFP